MQIIYKLFSKKFKIANIEVNQKHKRLRVEPAIATFLLQSYYITQVTIRITFN
jgi:hypothetical protein